MQQNKSMLWVGTSLSESLNVKQLESDIKMSVKTVSIDHIKDDNENYNSTSSAETVVKNILKKDSPDILVLQAGSEEITNIDVNSALSDKNNSIESYKQVWAEKVKQDSESLLSIAEEAIKQNENLNVVVVKRPPRYDKKSADPVNIKRKLSQFANNVFDQAWFSKGGPKKHSYY